MRPSILQKVDPVRPRCQFEDRLAQIQRAGFLQDQRRALCTSRRLCLDKTRRNRLDPRQPEPPRRRPDHLALQHLLGDFDHPVRIQRPRALRTHGLGKPLRDQVQNLPPQPRIRIWPDRVELAQTQDPLGIDFVGVADQPRDIRHWKLARAGVHGRARRRALRRGARRYLLQRLCLIEPDLPPCPHLLNRLGATFHPQPFHHIEQSVQPARAHRLRLGIAHGAGQHHARRAQRLLEVMRGKPDLPLGQQ